MKEVDIQRELVKEARSLGGYAHKLTNAFTIGIPDLLIKLPMHPAALVEAKVEHWPKTDKGHIAIDPTPQQLKHLRDAHTAGMVAGMVICCADPARAGRWRLMPVPFGHIGKLFLSRGDFSTCLVREPGGKWHINDLITRIQAQ